MLSARVKLCRSHSRKILKGGLPIIQATQAYGGIREKYIVGTGRSLGFEFGFAVAAVHFQRGYRGGEMTTFREQNHQ